jgi:sigma-54 dependent transcriptional regulator, acetoin dehydrogenase operon transcriptional activator AcoR
LIAYENICIAIVERLQNLQSRDNPWRSPFVIEILKMKHALRLENSPSCGMIAAVTSIASTPLFSVLSPAQRLADIAKARTAVMRGGAAVPEDAGSPLATGNYVAPWITQSWRRCMANGHVPEQAVEFEAVSTPTQRRFAEQNRLLRDAGRGVIDSMQHTLARTGYFALLTNAQGMVVDTGGPIDMLDPRANSIARVGVDLSEQAVGTTAIGAALAELKPVWLHRGEHFFNGTAVYSCAGAPIFGSDGACMGMLDLTGIEAPERRELQHLVAQAATQIENRLAIAIPHALSVQLYWPGLAAQQDTGWLGLDADGRICAANRSARSMLGLPSLGVANALPHCHDVFAVDYAHLFDAVRSAKPVEVPLWSGLTVTAQGQAHGPHLDPHFDYSMGQAHAPLKTLTSDFIRQTVTQTRGNVSLAAQSLGISRATVYRKLGGGKHAVK